ncbi:hypothetical protein SprV_0200896700 [Sparganum proliferum]
MIGGGCLLLSGLCALVVGTGAAAADVEAIEKEEERVDGSVDTGGRTVLIVGVTGRLLPETSAGSVGVARWAQLSFERLAFGFSGGDAVGFVDHCACLHCLPPGRSLSDEAFLVSRVDQQMLQESLQSVLVAEAFAPLAAGTRGDTTEESFG